jgi:hypothetical protein
VVHLEALFDVHDEGNDADRIEDRVRSNDDRLFVDFLDRRSGLLERCVPVNIVFSGTSSAIAMPALMTEPAPTVTPGRIMVRAPSHTPSPMTIGAHLSAPARRLAGPLS